MREILFLVVLLSPLFVGASGYTGGFFKAPDGQSEQIRMTLYKTTLSLNNGNELPSDSKLKVGDQIHIQLVPDGDDPVFLSHQVNEFSIWVNRDGKQHLVQPFTQASQLTYTVVEADNLTNHHSIKLIVKGRPIHPIFLVPGMENEGLNLLSKEIKVPNEEGIEYPIVKNIRVWVDDVFVADSQSSSITVDNLIAGQKIVYEVEVVDPNGLPVSISFDEGKNFVEGSKQVSEPYITTAEDQNKLSTSLSFHFKNNDGKHWISGSDGIGTIYLRLLPKDPPNPAKIIEAFIKIEDELIPIKSGKIIKIPFGKRPVVYFKAYDPHNNKLRGGVIPLRELSERGMYMLDFYCRNPNRELKSEFYLGQEVLIGNFEQEPRTFLSSEDGVPVEYQIIVANNDGDLANKYYDDELKFKLQFEDMRTWRKRVRLERSENVEDSGSDSGSGNEGTSETEKEEQEKQVEDLASLAEKIEVSPELPRQLEKLIVVLYANLNGKEGTDNEDVELIKLALELKKFFEVDLPLDLDAIKLILREDCQNLDIKIPSIGNLIGNPFLLIQFLQKLDPTTLKFISESEQNFKEHVEKLKELKEMVSQKFKKLDELDLNGDGVLDEQDLRFALHEAREAGWIREDDERGELVEFIDKTLQ